MRRAYANAEHDLGFAYARTHAAMDPLGATLGISRADNVATDAAGWSQGDDAPTRCPVIVAEVPSVDHSELDARAEVGGECTGAGAAGGCDTAAGAWAGCAAQALSGRFAERRKGPRGPFLVAQSGCAIS